MYKAMNKSALFKSAGLFLFAYLLLVGLSLPFGHHYVEALLPLYHWEIGLLSPDYSINSLALTDNHGEAVVSLNLKLIRYTVVGMHVMTPGFDVSSSTLAGHALQHIILMLSLLIAWPAKNIYHRFGLLVLSVPMLLFVELIDVPLVLLGSIDDLILANVAPNTTSPLVLWTGFMNGGGRLAFSLTAAVMCPSLLGWITKYTFKQSSLESATVLTHSVKLGKRA